MQSTLLVDDIKNSKPPKKAAAKENSALSWAAPLLHCPHCNKGELAFSATTGQCKKCKAAYPIRNAVPLLIDPDSYVDVATTLSPHMRNANPAAIETALGSALRFQLHDRGKRAEFSNIIDRYDVINASHPATHITATDATESQPPFTHVASYFEPNFAPSATRYRSIRIKNNTNRTLATSGANPFSISYWIYRDNELICGNGIRSAFPVPVAPGDELTVPVQIQAPDEAGTYKIVVMVIEEYVRWYEDCPLLISDLNVTTNPMPWSTFALDRPTESFDYQQDVARCGECYAQAIDTNQSRDKDTIKVLELACGSRPQSLIHYQKNTRVIAADLCFPQVQLGKLEFNEILPEVLDDFLFCCADVYGSPFKQDAFDVAVICAALHHFSDTVEALKLVAGFLKPRGNLVLLREPCFVNPADVNYLRELQNGFNEQQFEIEEYFWMLEKANFTVGHIQVDFGGSLKLIAVKN